MAALLLFLSGCEEKPAKTSQEEKEEPLLLEVKGVNLTGWDEQGNKSWEIQADSGRQFVDRMTVANVRFRLLEEGRPASGGEVDKVVVDIKSSDLFFEGKVKLTSYTDGSELLTSNLKWIVRDKKLTTEDKVVFRREGLTTEGWGLIADPELGEIEIKREVVTSITGG